MNQKQKDYQDKSVLVKFFTFLDFKILRPKPTRVLDFKERLFNTFWGFLHLFFLLRCPFAARVVVKQGSLDSLVGKRDSLFAIIRQSILAVPVITELVVTLLGKDNDLKTEEKESLSRGLSFFTCCVWIFFANNYAIWTQVLPQKLAISLIDLQAYNGKVLFFLVTSVQLLLATLAGKIINDWLVEYSLVGSQNLLYYITLDLLLKVFCDSPTFVTFDLRLVIIGFIAIGLCIVENAFFKITMKVQPVNRGVGSVKPHVLKVASIKTQIFILKDLLVIVFKNIILLVVIPLRDHNFWYYTNVVINKMVEFPASIGINFLGSVLKKLADNILSPYEILNHPFLNPNRDACLAYLRYNSPLFKDLFFWSVIDTIIIPLILLALLERLVPEFRPENQTQKLKNAGYYLEGCPNIKEEMNLYFKKKNRLLYLYFFITLVLLKTFDFVPYWGSGLMLTQVVDLYTKIVIMREQLKQQILKKDKRVTFWGYFATLL